MSNIVEFICAGCNSQHDTYYVPRFAYYLLQFNQTSVNNDKIAMYTIQMWPQAHSHKTISPYMTGHYKF
jgi:hypothetical protein